MFLLLIYKIIIKLVIIYGICFTIFEINKKGLKHYTYVWEDSEEIDSEDLVEILISFIKKFKFFKKIIFIF
jgi:hypothetical protein